MLPEQRLARHMSLQRGMSSRYRAVQLPCLASWVANENCDRNASVVAVSASRCEIWFLVPGKSKLVELVFHNIPVLTHFHATNAITSDNSLEVWSSLIGKITAMLCIYCISQLLPFASV